MRQPLAETGEVCDTRHGDGCSAVCRSNETCGNGMIDVVTGEACDDGNNIDADGCQASCTLRRCGGGILDVQVSETCDDGNRIGGDGCSAPARPT